MDTSDLEISFDERGVCNHCQHFEFRNKTDKVSDADAPQRLTSLVEKIKKAGEGKPYDCIIGISGGVDSTYVAYLAKKILGLRPLAIHFDNGWNSELAVRNIEYCLKRLNIDLSTFVIDWEEFRDLQLSFIKASVHNLEIPTDHAINALLFETAAKHGIRYILSGSNVVTEAIMPASWGYDAKDWKHIRAIHRIFGTKKLKRYPHFSLLRLAYYVFVKGIKFIPVLNYVSYNKPEVMTLLQKELDWKYYGGKHYESIYTRFFQGYILPAKYGVDKRRAHFATLINSGQMTREAALAELKTDPYPAELFQQDKEFVLKKLGLSIGEFDRLMADPVKSHAVYPSNMGLFERMGVFVAFAKKVITHNY